MLQQLSQKKFNRSCCCFSPFVGNHSSERSTRAAEGGYCVMLSIARSRLRPAFWAGPGGSTASFMFSTARSICSPARCAGPFCTQPVHNVVATKKVLITRLIICCACIGNRCPFLVVLRRFLDSSRRTGLPNYSPIYCLLLSKCLKTCARVKNYALRENFLSLRGSHTQSLCGCYF